LAFKVFSTYGEFFLKGARSTLEEINTIDNSAESTGRSFDTMSGKAKAAALAIGIAVTALAAKSVQAATDFEKGFGNVATLLDGDVTPRINELRENVKDLMLETGKGAETLTDGLYQTISAFGDTSDSMGILKVAAKGATAGNAEVTDSVNLLSAVMKGYNDVSEAAAMKTSDLAFQTVKLGQTSFPELASSMGKVIPIAASLKVSQEELFAQYATLTGVTGTAAEVTTQLRSVYQSFMKPSKEFNAQIKEMGFTTGAAALESLGTVEALKQLKDSVGGNEVQFANLFSSVEASTAAIALAGNQYDTYVEKAEKMNVATGSTERAFKKQTETVAGMKERFDQLIQVIVIGFGEELMPIVNDFLSWVIKNMPEIRKGFEEGFGVITPLIKGFVTLMTEALKLAGFLSPALIGLAAAFATLAIINTISKGMALFTLATEGATIAQAAMNLVLGLSPLGQFALVVGAVVTVIALLVKNMDKVVDIFNSVTTAISEAVEALGKFLGISRPSYVSGDYSLLPKNQYANGTNNAARGVALVGEEGPELVNFGGGETVVPNDKLGMSSPTINVNMNVKDLDELRTANDFFTKVGQLSGVY